MSRSWHSKKVRVLLSSCLLGSATKYTACPLCAAMDEEKFAQESIPATGEPGDMLVCTSTSGFIPRSLAPFLPSSLAPSLFFSIDRVYLARLLRQPSAHTSRHCISEAASLRTV